MYGNCRRNAVWNAITLCQFFRFHFRYSFSAYATLDSAQWKCPPFSPTAKELRNSQFFSVGKRHCSISTARCQGQAKSPGFWWLVFPSGTESRNSLLQANFLFLANRFQSLHFRGIFLERTRDMHIYLLAISSGKL